MERLERIGAEHIASFNPEDVITIQDGWFYAFNPGIKHGIIRKEDRDIAFVVLNGNSAEFPHVSSSDVKVYQRFGYDVHYHCEDALMKVIERNKEKFVVKKTKEDRVMYIPSEIDF
jgi:hypothetical protein